MECLSPGERKLYLVIVPPLNELRARVAEALAQRGEGDIFCPQIMHGSKSSDHALGFVRPPGTEEPAAPRICEHRDEQVPVFFRSLIEAEKVFGRGIPGHQIQALAGDVRGLGDGIEQSQQRRGSRFGSKRFRISGVHKRAQMEALDL